MMSCDCRYDEDPPDPDDEYEEDDWDEENNDLVYLKYCFEGAESLGVLSELLRSFADHLDEQANDGWYLNAPVAGGHAHLTRVPLRGRPDM